MKEHKVLSIYVKQLNFNLQIWLVLLLKYQHMLRFVDTERFQITCS
jgi:hypothetical protein